MLARTHARTHAQTEKARERKTLVRDLAKGRPASHARRRLQKATTIVNTLCPDVFAADDMHIKRAAARTAPDPFRLVRVCMRAMQQLECRGAFERLVPFLGPDRI